MNLNILDVLCNQNALFTFVGEPYKRMILVFSLVNYYFIVRALLGKPKLNKAQ